MQDYYQFIFYPEFEPSPRKGASDSVEKNSEFSEQ